MLPLMSTFFTPLVFTLSLLSPTSFTMSQSAFSLQPHLTQELDAIPLSTEPLPVQDSTEPSWGLNVFILGDYLVDSAYNTDLRHPTYEAEDLGQLITRLLTQVESDLGGSRGQAKATILAYLTDSTPTYASELGTDYLKELSQSYEEALSLY